MQQMHFSSFQMEDDSVLDSELLELGGGKGWESPLSPLGLVL